ncbi:hypothetical protein D3C72_1281510 [compost metagenome]
MVMASPAVPMIADWVMPPAARPLSRWNSLASTTTVTRPHTAMKTAMAISRSELRFSELKNCGPLS